MASDLNLIVQSLNGEPFNIGTSLVAFDSIGGQRLLQILSDVICWITQTDKIDIARESAEDTAMRIFHHLRILKYRPPTDIEELEEWRAGMVEGAKKSIYPVLTHLFSNVDMLKERSYLAKYLVKVEIPSEVHDVDTAQLQNELAQLMENFKEVHSRVVEVRQDSMMLDDIRSDLKSMEQEREALMRKIEKAERKVANLPGLEKYMSSAEFLRVQKERLAELTMQRTEQREAVIHSEQKLQRLRGLLSEVTEAGANLDPTELIEQLQDEIATNNYMVQTKLANDIETRRKVVHELSKVSDMPAIDQKDIQELQNRITETTNRIMGLEEARDKSEEGLDDNFSIFRHQAAAVERKKDAVAEKLQAKRQELSRLEEQVDERKKELKTRSGVDVISGKEFRNYVSHLRARTAEYKKKRQELDEMVSEKGTLVRTMEMLSAKFNQLKETIESMGGEVDENITIEVVQRPRTAAPRSENVDELHHLVRELMEKLDRKRDEIEPLKREKEQIQSEHNELSEQVKSRKAEFDRRKEQLEQGYATLKQEVESLEHRMEEAITQISVLEGQVEEAEKTLQELSRDGEGLRERLEAELREEESTASDYMARGGTGGQRHDEEAARKQVSMWRDLHAIFEAKLALANGVTITDMSTEDPIGDI